jgi:hydrogenase-1 operon protein HyaF
MVHALLCEIEEKLTNLITSGETARIDLRRLPLPAGGLQAMRDWLGKGEVEATMRGVGSCCFEETALSGVWLGTQRNTEGETVGEFVEITSIPELLKADQADMQDAIETLRQRLTDVSQ